MTRVFIGTNGRSPVRNQSKLTRLFRAELEILNIQSEQQQPKEMTLSTISTHVRRPCELLANYEFSLRGSDSFRSSEPPKKLMHQMHAINDPCTVPTPAQYPVPANRASKIV